MQLNSLSISQLIVLCIFLIAFIVLLTKFLKNKNLKTKLFEIENVKPIETKSENIIHVMETIAQYDKEFKEKILNSLEIEVLNIPSYLPDIIPPLWKNIISGIICDVFMESVMRNHIGVKLSTEKAFKDWLGIIHSRFDSRFNLYKQCTSISDDINWVRWINGEKIPNCKNHRDILTKIKLNLFSELRIDYLDYLCKVVRLLGHYKEEEKIKLMYEKYLKLYERVEGNLSWYMKTLQEGN